MSAAIYIHRGLHSFTNIQTLFDFIDLKGGVEMHVQVKLFQKHLFSHQLITHNTTKDFSWKLQAQNIRRTWCVHKLFFVLTFRTIFVHNMFPDVASFWKRYTCTANTYGKKARKYVYKKFNFLTWLSTSMAISMNMSWSSLIEVSSFMISACLASISAKVCLAWAVSIMIPCKNQKSKIRFTLLMWGHIKKRGKGKPHISRLL